MDKNSVQLVISHVEGSSGNFLGYVYGYPTLESLSNFRVDLKNNPWVLSIDGKYNWDQEMYRLDDHQVVVTHCFDKNQIQKWFPNSELIQIYPKTLQGNVLWNISHKKLSHSIPNILDSHCIQIQEWLNTIRSYPNVDLTQCVDYAELRDMSRVENLLNIRFNQSQKNFFGNYWNQQLPLELNIPNVPMRLTELVDHWHCWNYFDPWFAAFSIVIYELINNLSESQRRWSIDTVSWHCWQDVILCIDAPDKYFDV